MTGDLCDEPIIVLNSAEDGQGYERPVLRRWLQQFGIGIGNGMGRLGGTCAVVVASEFAHHSSNVVLVEEDEVIQRVFSKCTVKSLDVGIGIGRTVRRRQALNTHDVGKPVIEVAAIASASRVLLGMPELPEEPVVVVQ